MATIRNQSADFYIGLSFDDEVVGNENFYPKSYSFLEQNDFSPMQLLIQIENRKFIWISVCVYYLEG